jgi:uncharacterized protein
MLEDIVYDDNMQEIDWSVIVGFEWDDGNGRKSAAKHGVGQPEAEQVFFNEPLIVRDERHSSREERFHALGPTNLGQLLHVTFTLRGDGSLIRVISARPMGRKEVAIYEQEAQAAAKIRR